MRYRNNATTSSFTGTRRAFDAVSNVLLEANDWSQVVTASSSHIWDDPTGGDKVNKPCIHQSYVLNSWQPVRDVYHGTDMRNDPLPGTKYTGYHFGFFDPALRLPTGLVEDVDSYIPVTAQSTDDIAGYVFQAYNQFVNGVRALDASQSIAESGETPRLFQIWQRRKGLAANLVSGFLSYSFGWKPLINDLRAIRRELVSFPKTVRKRLKAIGDKEVVRHYRFNCSDTVDPVAQVSESGAGGLSWQHAKATVTSTDKSRVVVVTIRAKVKPKLTGEGQDLLNKLGAMGLIPSLATVWAVTRLSFVVDWFYNIGGAIENLQGSLTHNISDVKVSVSDTRTLTLEYKGASTLGANAHKAGDVSLRLYKRSIASVPKLPPVRLPRRQMQYVLLGLLSLQLTKRGQSVLRGIDGTRLSKSVTDKINKSIDKNYALRKKEVRKILAKNGESLFR